jgi:hypothetical protein
VPCLSGHRSRQRGIAAAIVLVVVALLGGAFGPRGKVVRAAPYRYDTTAKPHHSANGVGANEARSALASNVREDSLSSPTEALRTAMSDVLSLPQTRLSVSPMMLWALHIKGCARVEVMPCATSWTKV